MLDFQNIKHALLPGQDFFILGFVPARSTQVSIYIIDEFHNVRVEQVIADTSGLLILESNWFSGRIGKFQVYVLYNNTVQIITSTLDSSLQVDLLLYYRKKGDFYCKAAGQTFVTGELPADRVHTIYHDINYN